MRTPAVSGRVPGFPSVPGASEPADVGRAERDPGAGDTAASSVRPGDRLDVRAGTRPLSVRVLVPLLTRYKRLVRDLDDEGFETTLTEVVHALLLAGPDTPAEARAQSA